jgi:hypothetical protein
MTEAKSEVVFVQWGSIVGLHNVIAAIQQSKAWMTDARNEKPGTCLPPCRIARVACPGWFHFLRSLAADDIAFTQEITYRGKVKLHGSNGCITIRKQL